MGQGPKPAKGKTKPAVARKSPKDEGARVRDLEKRLAEALKDKAEALDREAVAQEQQAATAEILRAISSSPTELESVLGAVAQNASRLCGAGDVSLYRVEGGLMRKVAEHGPPLTALRVGETRPITRMSVSGRAIIDRTTIHLRDPQAAEAAREYPDVRRDTGIRTTIGIPLIREGMAIGVFTVYRTETRPFSEREIALLQTFADQAVIAIENVRLFYETKEALDRQTATSEILQVISGSLTDVQPVFQTILARAVELCGAQHGSLFGFDGELLHEAAHHGVPEATREIIRRDFPRPPTPGHVSGRAILARRIVTIEDVLVDAQYESTAPHAGGFRSMVGVPMLKDGKPIGVIVIVRSDPGPFTDRQIALLQTFADQAVIAIENVRLFTELQEKNRALTEAHAQVSEALDQQTATAEILRVISSSPTDVQPVFDTIARRAVRLCNGLLGGVYRFDGELIHFVAHHNWTAEGLETVQRIYPRVPSRETQVSTAILDGVVVEVRDFDAAGVPPSSVPLARALGYRSILVIPMLRQGKPIGAIAVARAETGPFSPKEIELLHTFADQAVIAIENVRLFKELEARNNDLTATGGILRVIASSPTDLQPAFNAIASSALRLCKGVASLVFRYDGTLIHLAASDSAEGIDLEVIRHNFPAPPERATFASRVVTMARPQYIADIERDPDAPPGLVEFARANGFRSIFAAPMRREDQTIGLIAVTHRAVGGFTPEQGALLQTFADQAVIAIENVRLFTELKEKNQALTVAHAQMTEALDQQTATSEVLKVISRSTFDLDPVLQTLVENAARLCGAQAGLIYRVEDGVFRVAAHYATSPEILEVAARVPIHADRGSATGRAALERRTVHIPDVLADPEYTNEQQQQIGNRTIMAVPMQREGTLLGVFALWKTRVQPFTDKQIELVTTFADQAVIAIENVRLFTELETSNRDLTTSLDRQTATGEILRVISSSPMDVQPVFDGIAESVRRLCRGTTSAVLTYDGELIHLVALSNINPAGTEALRQAFPRPPSRATTTTRAILTGEVVMIPDVQEDPDYTLAGPAQVAGYRNALSVPMRREGRTIGEISVMRAEPGSFAESEIELLQTFADQAVIAIENVRLFSELQTSNRELTTALDTQTATSDILRVISRSQTNVQPVFDAILGSAARLLKSYSTGLTQVAGDRLQLAAFTNTDPTGDAFMRAHFPLSLDSDDIHCQAVRDRAPVVVTDVEIDLRLSDDSRAYGRARGWRSAVVVPMLRHGAALGSIGVSRREAGGFTGDEIALLQTFADQAVIAIENARLLSELQERNAALTEALEQQTATSAILTVIASSPTDVQPVLDAVAENAARLCHTADASVLQADRGVFRVMAYRGAARLKDFEGTQVSRGSVAGRAILDGQVVHVHNITQESDAEFSVSKALMEHFGHSTMLAAPLLRQGTAIGAIFVRRTQVDPFSDKQIALLQTFADQAVIAIENVRLFTELQTSNRDLTTALDTQTATADILAVISRSQTDVQPVFDAIIASAVRLLGGYTCGLTRVTGDQLELVALTSIDAAADDPVRAAFPQSLQAVGAHPQAIRDRVPLNVADAHTDGRLAEGERVFAGIRGFRSWVVVPMLRDDVTIGSIGVTRREAGGFTADEIALLQMFADQAVIAIENVRLFKELEAANRELAAASQHKSEFLANMSHELRTPLNAIIGFSEVLTDRMFGELNEKQDEYLKDIYASGTHLLSLINDILDLSKIEAGRMELELTDFHLPTALDNALMLVRERAQRRSLTLHQDVDAGVDQVRADERKIRQVVLNLLSNAIKFTPEGGRIELAAVLKDGCVEVSVSDTGVGIAREDQEKVFEEFRQVGTAEKKAEGTGLGLTLCRKFIELHGGRIWVQSQVGMGSTFTFTIPVRRGE